MKKLFQRQHASAEGVSVIEESSRDAARRRLQLVLVQDRMGLSPEILESMKDDLLKAISKHVTIEQDSVEMKISRTGDSVMLMSNFRVAEFRKHKADVH